MISISGDAPFMKSEMYVRYRKKIDENWKQDELFTGDFNLDDGRVCLK